MTAKLPNLELILYKAKQILGGSQKFMEKVHELKLAEEAGRRHVGMVILEYDIDVFPQTWGNTGLGFDKGENGFNGQAMTKAYTTVVHEIVTDFYVVFFGGKPCYMIDKVTDDFLSDLKERRLVGQTEAAKKY